MDSGRLAFVGAYERDNFGDILFPWETRRLLSDKAGVHHLAAFDGRVDDLVEENVRAYTKFLRSEVPISGLWSVGGEIGGLDGPGALCYVSSDPGEQERASAGEMPFAYLPQPSRFLTSLSRP